MEKVIKEDSILYVENDVVKARIDFKHVTSDIIDIVHTIVDESLKGQGIAKKLVEDVIEYAKENSFKIKATCSYAKHYFEKNPSDIYLE